MPPKHKKSSQYTEAELKEMGREELIAGMSDREIAFCEYYIQDYNLKMACIKAGYSVSSSRNIGLKLRQKQQINDYICWLKLRLFHQACIKAEDVLNQYAKMAFYDITDYVEKVGNKIKIKNFDEIDGQLIQEISQNASGGINVKFPDRLKSMERLENFLEPSPLDWKRNMEERKLKILEERLVIEKAKVGIGEELEDDGFIEALEKAALDIFNDDESLREGEED